MRDVLASLKGPVKFVPNGGNAGDCLINAGFYDLADDVGLTYTRISRKDPNAVVPGDTVLISGGGALVPEWPATPAFLSEVIERTKRVVILPQSVRGVEDLLESFRPSDILMCREQFSFDHCQAVGVTCELILTDDLAFGVEPDRLRAQTADWRPPVNAKNLVREAAISYHRIRSSIRPSVDAWRNDREASDDLQVSRRWVNDFASVTRFESESKVGSRYSARRLMDLVDFYDEIHTDRLHVMITAALLGKRIVAHSGSYWKVQGVIDQSLSDYPRLDFRG